MIVFLPLPLLQVFSVSVELFSTFTIRNRTCSLRVLKDVLLNKTVLQYVWCKLCFSLKLLCCKVLLIRTVLSVLQGIILSETVLSVLQGFFFIITVLSVLQGFLFIITVLSVLQGFLFIITVLCVLQGVLIIRLFYVYCFSMELF